MKNINLLLLLLFLASCTKESKKDNITKVVTAWQNKEIVFPKNMIFTRFGEDTLNYQITKTKYKIVLYVDSNDCTWCKLQLSKWKELIGYFDSISKKNVSFIPIIHPKEMKEIQSILKKENFDKPVCIDNDDKFNKLNKLPKEIILQTFLLENNKVKIIGNPTYSEEIKKIYTNLLVEDTDKKQIKTSIQLDQALINFSSATMLNNNYKFLVLKNIGKSPLIIYNINSSCKCISTEYDKKSVKPGEAIKIKIVLSSNLNKFINEYISIKCNSKDSPIKVLIKGNFQ